MSPLITTQNQTLLSRVMKFILKYLTKERQRGEKRRCEDQNAIASAQLWLLFCMHLPHR